jgi:hypothetical protein
MKHSTALPRQDDGTIFVASYFCTHTPEYKPPATGKDLCLGDVSLFFHSILSQIFHQSPDLISKSLSHLKTIKKTWLFKSFIFSQTGSDALLGSHLLELLKCVMKLLQESRLMLFVDAISALNLADRSQILSFLVEIVKAHPDQYLKVFVTTQVKKDVVKVLEGFEFVDQSAENKREIRCYHEGGFPLT